MKSILIATEKVDHLIILTGLLQKRGYVVIPAVTGDDALTFLRQGVQVDAVIADYEVRNFPGLLTAVRSHGPVPPPLILMHDRVAVSDYLTALNAGAFDFFFWPIRPSEFLRVVEVAVRQDTGESDAATRHQGLFAADTVRSAFDSFGYLG